MQGLVTIDFGNSHPHAGIFIKGQDQWQIIKVVAFDELQKNLDELKLSPHNSQLVLSEVKSRDQLLKPLLEQGYLLTRIKDYWRGNKFAGMPVNYSSTLGEDRLIEAFYVFKKIKQNCLIIDAGTFVTMDVVDSSGFQGGHIIPGLEIYGETFLRGEQLKATVINHELSIGLPHNTSEAMRDGYTAFAALALKLVHDFKLEKILLTGGQCHVWEKIFSQFATSVIVQTRPDLIHWALQYWMTTQIEPL
jgi:type III pantothenate kinase